MIEVLSVGIFVLTIYIWGYTNGKEKAPRGKNGIFVKYIGEKDPWE